jgi:hypothetical protein
MATPRQNTTTYMSEPVEGKWFTNIVESRKIQQGEIQTAQGAKFVKIYFDGDKQKWGISVVGTPQGKKLPEEIELRFPTTDGDEYTFSAKKVSPYCGGTPPPPPLISAWGQPQPQPFKQPQKTQALLPLCESVEGIHESMKDRLSKKAALQDTVKQLKVLLSGELTPTIKANLIGLLEDTEGKLKKIPAFSEREETLLRFLEVFCEPDCGEQGGPEKSAEGEEGGAAAAAVSSP